MPSWKSFLQILVLLAIGGFVLTILSGFWHIIGLMVVAVALVSLWRNRPSGKK